jgi:hypothetical protein
LRRSDEQGIVQDGDILASRNDGLIVIEKRLITKPDEQHVLFTMANGQSCR